jgi:hypothetical protein
MLMWNKFRRKKVVSPLALLLIRGHLWEAI